MDDWSSGLGPGRSVGPVSDFLLAIILTTSKPLSSDAIRPSRKIAILKRLFSKVNLNMACYLFKRSISISSDLGSDMDLMLPYTWAGMKILMQTMAICITKPDRLSRGLVYHLRMVLKMHFVVQINIAPWMRACNRLPIRMMAQVLPVKVPFQTVVARK